MGTDLRRKGAYIDCYEIGNVYYPILYKINKKQNTYKDQWIKSLETIKEWN
jgi:hypothetical protein